ncbi:LamG-like jellyroll fold domain-containing protein [Marinobacterium iners]|uniref:LamG-like jellyroll fold domain-containing protein n=1 Tax=Marinobacterium iners TaxID=48076 RepID=UPI001A8DB290|nr:LamG-like jellyroll fold domain-containing protein [Marinobacterium iners]
MENVSGSTLIDETGNHDGTIYGATTGVGYLGFDGSDRVDIATLIANPQSFSFFVDVTPDLIRTAPYESGVVHMIDGYGAVTLIFQNGTIKFYLYDGSFTILTAPATAGIRYKIIAQFSGGVGELYVNGGLVDSAGGIGSILYRGDESGRRLGSNYNNLSNYRLDGKIWEYAEYNRLLTSAEISEHFA